MPIHHDNSNMWWPGRRVDFEFGGPASIDLDHVSSGRLTGDHHRPAAALGDYEWTDIRPRRHIDIHVTSHGTIFMARDEHGIRIHLPPGMTSYPKSPIRNAVGDKYYFNEEGYLHREGGPAIELEEGSRMWAKNGELHREDGPAIEWGDGTVEWHLEGNDITSSVESHYREQGIAYPPAPVSGYDATQDDVLPVDPGEYDVDAAPVEYSPLASDGNFYRVDPKVVAGKASPVRDPDGDIYYFDDDLFLHRDNGPAILRRNGSLYWIQQGTPHREDGPAIIMDGAEYWMQHGQLHRTDGPAIMSDIDVSWYRRGKNVTPDEAVAEDWNPVFEIKVHGGSQWMIDTDVSGGAPSPFVSATNNVYYFDDNGRIHRDDGPAIVYANGNERWFQDGRILSTPRNVQDDRYNGETKDVVAKDRGGEEMQDILPRYEDSRGAGRQARHRRKDGSMGTQADVHVHFR